MNITECVSEIVGTPQSNIQPKNEELSFSFNQKQQMFQNEDINTTGKFVEPEGDKTLSINEYLKHMKREQMSLN